MTADSDQVDLLIDAWAGQLPEIDFSSLEVTLRLRRISVRVNSIRAAAFHTAGLTLWEFDVLAALRRAGEPFQLSPSQLAVATMASSGTCSDRLDRLGKRGFIQRRRNLDNHRGVLVHMTNEGREHVDRAMIALLASEETQLGALHPSERNELIDLLHRLNEVILVRQQPGAAD